MFSASLCSCNVLVGSKGDAIERALLCGCLSTGSILVRTIFLLCSCQNVQGGC